MNTRVEEKKKIIKFPINKDWEKELSLNNLGNISNTIENYCIILRNHEKFAGKIKLNELSNTEEFNGKSVQQIDYDNIQRIVEKEYGIYSEKKLASAIRSIASENKYHPIREYLESLKWDGIKRADTAFADYFGAEPSDYNAMCIRLILFGAIERAFHPGCKFDSMVILKGAQGLGKSTFFRIMCNDNINWYLEDLKDLEKPFDYTNGKWIVEVAELSALNKTDKNRIKSYITTRSEQHRIPYERQSKAYPRQFVLIGTTNNECILDDPTGERRFPIVECAEPGNKDKIKKRILWDNQEKYEQIKYDIQQILAEVYVEYTQGKKILKVPDEFENEFKNIQTRHYYEDTDVGFIEEFLEDKKETCFEQIWREALNHKQPRDKASKSDKERITNILLNMKNWKLYDGNEQHKKRISGKEYDKFSDSYKDISYGVQKAWVWYETEEDIKKRQEEELQKKQQTNANNINMITNQNKTYQDYYAPVNKPVSTIDDLKQMGIEIKEEI